MVCTYLHTEYPYKYPKCPIVVCTYLHTKYPYKYPKCPIEFQKGYEPTRSLARSFVGAFDRSIGDRRQCDARRRTRTRTASDDDDERGTIVCHVKRRRGWMDGWMRGWMSMDGWRGTPLRWRRRDTDDDDDDDDADDDAGDKPTNDGEMNENATRGRNVPGGMKEGTAVRRERFSMDDARSARGREGKLTDARPTRRFAR